MPAAQKHEMTPTGSVPVPDPTTLTRESILREIERVKEFFGEMINGKDTLFTSMIAGIKAVFDEKFNNVNLQFSGRDIALVAALQAAKEAVGEQNKSNAMAIAKSETEVTKQLDQIRLLINGSQKITDDKIDDMKARIQAIESNKVGTQEHKRDTSSIVGVVIGVAGLLIAAVAVAVAFVKH